MNHLILIRHAESEHHRTGLTGGWTNTPLSDAGHVQARAVAAYCRQRLAGTSSLRLVSSDLVRAAETAAYIATALAVPCEFEPALHELNNGLAAGLTLSDAKRLEQPMTEPVLDWVPYPHAESWHMMQQRVVGGMERIDRACPTTTVVVTHGNAGVVVIQWWLRLCVPCAQGISFELDPASVSELVINRWRERTVVRLNDTSHLPQVPLH